MASALDSRRTIVFSLLAIASTAVLVWYGNGLDPVWPLLWIAPLPVLYFATRSSWWAAALTAFFAWFLGSFSMWHYFHAFAPTAIFLSIYAGISLSFGLSVLLFRALLRRGSPWSAVLSVPSFWVVGEYISNLTTPHGTAGSLAYTQLHFLPFLQLASITGPWGMSFVLLLFPTTIAATLYLRSINRPRQSNHILAFGVGTVLAVLIFGAVRLAQPDPRTVTVGLITSDLRDNQGPAPAGAPTNQLFHDYSTQVEKLAAGGAQAIVLPEKLALVADPNTADTDSLFQSLANRTSATIVVGIVHIVPPVKFNQARVYTPNAQPISYNKQHLLPPFESDLQPGNTLTLLPHSGQTWGVAICKDMDFTRLSRLYGNSGVGLMLVPGWDFNVDRSWHGHMAIMRGVEDGFTIVRSAKDGYLTVSDDRGRVLAEVRSDSAPFPTLLTHVPADHHSTFYLRTGDWFPWIACAILLLCITRLLLPRSLEN
jgi:apolipoprotein N-acyltransferase